MRLFLVGLLVACTETAPKTAMTCTAEVDDEVSTLIHLRWDAPEGGYSWAEFSADDTLTLSTRATDDGDVSLLLVGAPADTEVTWTGITDVDGERTTCTGVTRTDPLPEEVPTWSVPTFAESSSSSPVFLLGVVYDALGDSHLTAIDRNGRVVWYGPMDPDGVAIQAELSLDGRGVYFTHLSKTYDSAPSSIRLVSLDGDLLEERLAGGLHHMFVQLPGDVIAFQALDERPVYNARTGETENWMGDAVVEVDADGVYRQVYSVWDWLTPVENERMYAHPTYDVPDWTHGNGLKYNPDTNRYLLSLGHVADVIEFDRTTGEPTRVFGTDGYLPADGPGFYFQHDPTLLDNGNLTLFVTDPDTHNVGAIEYAVDDAAQTIEPVWSYDAGMPAEFLGQVHRLPNGNTLINLGATSELREITPEGEIVWQARPDNGMPLGQFQMLESF